MVNQALDGWDLDLVLLDERVEKWRVNLDLIHQNNFPPPKFSITENGIKFHDRSHLLVQDYLGRDSYSLQEEYQEESLPSIYEEALTVFAAQVNHYRNKSPQELCNEQNFRSILYLLHRIDYIPQGSFFLTDIHRIAGEIAEDVAALVAQKNFKTFLETLQAASQDTLNWDDTRKKPNG